MKKFIYLLLLVNIMLASTNTLCQNSNEWIPPSHPDNKLGVIGSIWHPYGLIVNHSFGDIGMYATFKFNIDRKNYHLYQDNITGGFSIPIFKNTSRTNYSDLLVGVSYVPEPNGNYMNNCYPWGIEILLMLPFTDKDFRVIAGWSSNSIVMAKGITLGFVYQF